MYIFMLILGPTGSASRNQNTGAERTNATETKCRCGTKRRLGPRSAGGAALRPRSSNARSLPCSSWRASR